LLIVADRGRLLAYAVDESPRGPAPILLNAVHFAEGQQRLGEQVTDKAGAFPMAGSGTHQNSAAERMKLVAELEMRTFRRAATCIAQLVKDLQPESWGFAAPSEINGAILDGIEPTVRARLAQNVARDLTNTPREKLLGHFAPME
jgi:hypothetical protein